MDPIQRLTVLHRMTFESLRAVISTTPNDAAHIKARSRVSVGLPALRDRLRIIQRTYLPRAVSRTANWRVKLQLCRHRLATVCKFDANIVLIIQNGNDHMNMVLKELGTSSTHSAVIRCLTICQHIPVVRKNHKNQLTQQFDIICCLARGLTLCIESKQIMSLLSCEPATLKRGPQLCGQRCGPYFRH